MQEPSLLSGFIEEVSPKFNPYVLNGYATYVTPRIKEYLYKVIKSAISGFEDLQIVNIVDATPEEELRILRNKTNKYTFDIARNYIRLIRIDFSFQGELLPPKYVYVPFVDDAGIMYLSDALYHVTPILGDKVITKTPNGLFIRLIRDKILVNKFIHTILINHEKVPVNVLWAQIYRNENTSKKNLSIPKTTLVHYLLSHYGVSDFFQKFFGFKPKIYSTMDVIDEAVLTTHSVIESTGITPKVYATLPNYVAPKVKFLIPNTHLNKDVVDIIGSVIYILELYWPIFNSSKSLDNKDAWALSLGKIITFGKNYTNNKVYTVIMDHFNSLKSYIDEMIKDKLTEIGFNCRDFYELIGELLSKYSSLNDNPVINSSKYLEVIYYLLYPITESFYRFSFALNKSNREVTKKVVIDALNKNVKMSTIYRLTRSNSKNICEPISSSSDHKYFKFTSKIVEQEGFIPKTTKQRRLIVDESKHIKVKHVLMGSILYLMKSNPDPLTRINPFVKIDLKTGSILFDELDEMYDRKISPLFMNTYVLNEDSADSHRLLEDDTEIELD